MTEPKDDDAFVAMRLFCDGCKKEHTIALPGANILRRELATLACPLCKALGVLRLVRRGRDQGRDEVVCA